jgi:hypothetical protein
MTESTKAFIRGNEQIAVYIFGQHAAVVSRNAVFVAWGMKIIPDAFSIHPVKTVVGAYPDKVAAVLKHIMYIVMTQAHAGGNVPEMAGLTDDLFA